LSRRLLLRFASAGSASFVTAILNRRAVLFKPERLSFVIRHGVKERHVMMSRCQQIEQMMMCYSTRAQGKSFNSHKVLLSN
jgi:hypothetical protein